MGNGEMQGRGGLDLARRGGSHEQRPWPAAEVGKQNGIPQRLDRLFEGGVLAAVATAGFHQSLAPVAVVRNQRQPPKPRLHYRKRTKDFGFQAALDLLRIANAVIQDVGQNRGSHAEEAGKEERENTVEPQIREDREEGGPGGVGHADGIVLEAGVDPGFLDLVHQLGVESLIGLGLLLQRLVLKGTGVDPIKLGFDLSHGRLEHVFAIGRFLELDADPLRDVGLQGSELTFQLGDLGEEFFVLGVVGAVLRFHAGKLLAGLIQAIRQLAELLTLGGRLGGLQRTALHRIKGGLLADTIALGSGELRVELEQARGEDAGFLLRVNDAQVSFELRQSGGGALHFGFELFHLLLHEGGEAGSGGKADVIGVQDVALGDGVGDIGRKLRIWRAVADEQQVGVGRARDFQVFELHWSILHAGGEEFAVESCTLKVRNLEALDDGAQDGIRLDGFDLSGKVLIGVVGRHARSILANDAGGHLTINVDAGGGFIDGGKARRYYYGGSHAKHDEGEELPFVAPEYPEIVGEGDSGLLGFRLGITGRRIEGILFGNRWNGAPRLRSGEGADFFFFSHGNELLAAASGEYRGRQHRGRPLT